MLWNNQPDREAFGLVRKGVGQSTVLRAVETPYPKVNPIQSDPAQLFQSAIVTMSAMDLDFIDSEVEAQMDEEQMEEEEEITICGARGGGRRQ